MCSFEISTWVKKWQNYFLRKLGAWAEQSDKPKNAQKSGFQFNLNQIKKIPGVQEKVIKKLE